MFAVRKIPVGVDRRPVSPVRRVVGCVNNLRDVDSVESYREVGRCHKSILDRTSENIDTGSYPSDAPTALLVDLA